MGRDEYSDFEQDDEVEAFYGLVEDSPKEDVEDVGTSLTVAQSCESCGYFDARGICLKCRHYKGCTLSACAACN